MCLARSGVLESCWPRLRDCFIFRRPPDRVDKWLAEMHAPTGLDLGADTPAAIALSVVAEIQKVITAATGEPLRQIRAAKQPIACS